jgi:hypothetical protein
MGLWFALCILKNWQALNVGYESQKGAFTDVPISSK